MFGIIYEWRVKRLLKGYFAGESRDVPILSDPTAKVVGFHEICRLARGEGQRVVEVASRLRPLIHTTIIEAMSLDEYEAFATDVGTFRIARVLDFFQSIKGGERPVSLSRFGGVYTELFLTHFAEEYMFVKLIGGDRDVDQYWHAAFDRALRSGLFEDLLVEVELSRQEFSVSWPR
jgi:hypothetical protein